MFTNIAKDFILIAARKSDEMLEPYEGKLSRTVLREERASNRPDLLDYTELFTSLGGTVVYCTSGAARINPFEVRVLKTKFDKLKDEFDQFDDKTEFLPDIKDDEPVFFQHKSWLEDFFRTLFPKMPDLTLKALMVLVQDMYESVGINKATDFSLFTPADYPTFTTLYEYIDSVPPAKYSNMIAPEVFRDLRLYLKDCYDGSLSIILNGHTNIANTDLMCFSMVDLLQGSKERTQAVLFNITTYIWNIISRREKRVMLSIDELYLFLENTYMVKYVKDFAKRCRKYFAILGTGTQQLADCLKPEYAAETTAIINNASFQFLFHPGKIDLDLTKEKLRLTDGSGCSKRKHWHSNIRSAFAL